MKNNQELLRFELEIGGQIAYADYQIEGNILKINYVFAPPQLRGTGAAGSLMKEICQNARQNKMKIRPVCAYAAAWLERHKEYEDLLL